VRWARRHHFNVTWGTARTVRCSRLVRGLPSAPRAGLGLPSTVPGRPGPPCRLRGRRRSAGIVVSPAQPMWCQNLASLEQPRSCHEQESPRASKRRAAKATQGLRDMRRGEADTVEQVAKSREAIEDSWALLRRDERREGAQKPETRHRHSKAHGPDHATQKKTRGRQRV
jgi:hypothetical protein